jgi:hypothetical protein
METVSASLPSILFCSLPGIANKEDISFEAGWIVKGPNTWT